MKKINKLTAAALALAVMPAMAIGAAANETPIGDVIITAPDLQELFGIKLDTGDVDGDKSVTSNDALMILRYSVGLQSFNSAQKKAADVNGDDIIDSADALSVLRQSLGGTQNDKGTDTEKGSDTEKDIDSEKGTDSEKTQERVYAEEVLRLVNEERAKVGAPELTLDDKVCKAAQVRAGELVHYFSHDRPDGSSYSTALYEADVPFYMTSGENIAAGLQTPKTVVETWMSSDGHRENILDPNFKKMGLGYVCDTDAEYRYYWPQMFVG